MACRVFAVFNSFWRIGNSPNIFSQSDPFSPWKCNLNFPLEPRPSRLAVNLEFGVLWRHFRKGLKLSCFHAYQSHNYCMLACLPRKKNQPLRPFEKEIFSHSMDFLGCSHAHPLLHDFCSSTATIILLQRVPVIQYILIGDLHSQSYCPFWKAPSQGLQQLLFSIKATPFQGYES